MLGVLLLVAGVDSALNEGASSTPVNNADYPVQSLPNSKPKPKVAHVSRREKRKSEPVPRPNKKRYKTGPVVESTPPFPAINGTKWTRAKNGWVLGFADKPK